MSNLGLHDYRLTIDSAPNRFEWCISFFFEETGIYYTAAGAAMSPTQCFDAAMGFVAECMREAV